MAKSHIFGPLLGRSWRPHRLLNYTKDLILAEHIEAAFDSATRRKGLLGRDTLPEDTVIAIAPSNAIHTFGMRFTIDVLFISREGVVVKRVLDLKPRRAAATLAAFAVLEFGAAHPGVRSTEVGDRLTLLPVVSDQVT